MIRPAVAIAAAAANAAADPGASSSSGDSAFEQGSGGIRPLAKVSCVGLCPWFFAITEKVFLRFGCDAINKKDCTTEGAAAAVIAVVEVGAIAAGAAGATANHRCLRRP